MTSWISRAGCAAMISLIGFGAGTALAQESTNRVATKTDWSVFTEGTPKECWGVSKPKETVNTRNGEPVSARRGDILLFVTFRPGDGANGAISFTGGDPFAPKSTVTVEIDGASYEMFSDGEWAWPGTKDDDAAILSALACAIAALRAALFSAAAASRSA